MSANAERLAKATAIATVGSPFGVERLKNCDDGACNYNYHNYRLEKPARRRRMYLFASGVRPLCVQAPRQVPPREHFARVAPARTCINYGRVAICSTRFNVGFVAFNSTSTSSALNG